MKKLIVIAVVLFFPLFYFTSPIASAQGGIVKGPSPTTMSCGYVMGITPLVSQEGTFVLNIPNEVMTPLRLEGVFGLSEEGQVVVIKYIDWHPAVFGWVATVDFGVSMRGVAGFLVGYSSKKYRTACGFWVKEMDIMYLPMVK